MARKKKKAIKINPKEVQEIKPTDHIKTIIAELINNVIQDDQDRQQYLIKLENAYNQRLMKVDSSNAPWPGAPNYSMPFTDKQIRKRKPQLVNSQINPQKMAVVQVEPGVQDQQGLLKAKAMKAEQALNLFLRNKMNWIPNLILGVDYMLEKGRTYFKVLEKFESKVFNRTLRIKDFETIFGEEVVKAMKTLKEPEIMELLVMNTGFGFNIENDEDVETMQQIIKDFKSGEEEISFQLEKVESTPSIQAIPPDNIIIPADSPREVQEFSRITHEFLMSKQQLLNAVEVGQFDKKVVEDMIEGQENSEDDKSVLETEKDIDEGISQAKLRGMYKIWETHFYWKAPKAKREEKYVVTVFANQNDGEFLRFIREPNEDDVFPFVSVDNEIRDDRAFSSRGIPEMIRHIQEIIDDQENNRIRRDIINNTPFFTIRRQSGITSQSLQFIPGQGLVVDNHDDIVNHSLTNSTDISSERIEATAKAYGEEYIGSIDFAFNAGGQPGVGRGAKTLGEIQIASSEAQKIASLDFVVFNEAISKLYGMVFMILRERMGDNIVLEGQIITKEDFNFPVEVRSNGSLEESDRTFNTQKALARMQIMAQQDPNYVTLEDRFNSYIDYLQADGVKDLEKFATSPQQVLQDQTVQLQQQLAQGQQQLQLLTQELEKREKDLTIVEEKTRRSGIKAQVKRAMGKETTETITRTR